MTAITKAASAIAKSASSITPNKSANAGKETAMSQNPESPVLTNPYNAPATSGVSARRQVSPQAKEALLAYQKAQKEAKQVLYGFLFEGGADTCNLPEAVRKALEVLVPNKKASGGSKGKSSGSKVVLLDQLAEMFEKAADHKVSLMDIFKQFRMGEGEMRVRIRNLIYDRKPEARVWISYDADAEQYKLEGVGATPPKGWKGVLPKPPKAPEVK